MQTVRLHRSFKELAPCGCHHFGLDTFESLDVLMVAVAVLMVAIRMKTGMLHCDRQMAVIMLMVHGLLQWPWS